MDYAALDRYKARLEPVFGVAGLPDDAGLTDDLTSAESEINGSLAMRYAIPVTAPKTLPLLADWALTLAEERTYARTAGSTYAEKIKLRVDQVRKYLEMIRAKTFFLPDAAESESGGASISLVDCTEPEFTREKMKGY